MRNGYYFSTRYPGDDAMIMTQMDIDACISAIKAARSFAEQYEKMIKEAEAENTKKEP